MQGLNITNGLSKLISNNIQECRILYRINYSKIKIHILYSSSSTNQSSRIFGIIRNLHNLGVTVYGDSRNNLHVSCYQSQRTKEYVPLYVVTNLFHWRGVTKITCRFIVETSIFSLSDTLYYYYY